jgi:hypothetical protein
MKARIALVAFLVVLAAVHAVLAAWTPIQGDDWNHWIWAGQHQGAGIGTWIVAHLQFSDAIGYLLARCRVAHMIVTPCMFVALVIGLFTLAMRRLPRGEDLLGVTLVSALLWLGQPSAGITYFYTPYTASLVYGSTVAVWFAVPFRCGWNVRAPWLPLLVFAGYCAGTSTRGIAIALLVCVIVTLRRAPRQRWMWIAFAGLIVGVLAGFALPPWIEVPRVVRRGLEANLVLIKLPIEEIGELMSLTTAFFMLDLVLGAFGKQRAPASERPDVRPPIALSVIAFATSVVCLFGPKYNEALLLPATCLVLIACVPFVLWLARAPLTRYLVIALVIIVHVTAWSIALAKYHRFGSEGDARIATLQSTAPAQVAVVRPYSQTLSDFWFIGEDLGAARVRELVAIEGFGLGGVSLQPTFRRMELDPDVEIALEVEGISPAQLEQAHAPHVWASDIGAARKQFELFAKRLGTIVTNPVARLVVKNVTWDDPRPLSVSWIDANGTMNPRVSRSTLDENSFYTIRLYGAPAKQFKEAWIIDRGKKTETSYRGGSPRLRALTATLQVVIVCNPSRCLVADAFVPRL